MDSLLRNNYINSTERIYGWEESEDEFVKAHSILIDTDELFIERDDVCWSLQSHQDMQLPVRVWCDQFLDKDINYQSIFVIYGFGYKGYIEEMMERYPDNAFFIFEPFEQVITQQMQREDFSSLMSNKKLFIFTGEKRYEFWKKYMGSLIGYDNFHNLVYGVLPNYVKIDEDEYIKYRESVDYFVRNELETMKFMIHSENNRGRNALHNMYDFMKEAGIKELKEVFAELDLDRYPAVIVSAGPSLSKNVDELRKYKGKAFIVGVNASLRVLREHDIEPDIVLSLDPKIADISPFEEVENNKIPLLTAIISDYRVIQENQARRFYVFEDFNYMRKINKELELNLINIDNGGSVANAAYSFVYEMGFRNIIFVGQDLAYTNNKVHAGQRADEGEIDSNNGALVKVKGIEEEIVLSDAIFCTYRRWFEDKIAADPKCNVINATEGGAYIEGATHISLKQALAEQCKGQEIDFRQLINSAKRAFDEEKYQLITERFEESENHIYNIKSRLKAGLRVYDKLDELNRKQKYHTSQFKKCVEKLAELNDFIEEDMDVELVQLYVNKSEADATNQLREYKNETYDEIKLVVNSGRELLEGYINACDKLLEEWGKVHDMVAGMEG